MNDTIYSSKSCPVCHAGSMLAHRENDRIVAYSCQIAACPGPDDKQERELLAQLVQVGSVKTAEEQRDILKSVEESK
jgi:hypothetical protein